VLILVVSDVERQAVLESVRREVRRDAVKDDSGKRTVYIVGSVAGTEVLLGQAAEQGTASAGAMLVTAEILIEQCRPDYVVLTGICYGLRQEEGQQIGDVVISRRIHNLDHRKLTDDADRPIQRRGINVGCSPGLLDRFQASVQSWPGARVHIGTVLTSNTLMDSHLATADLRDEFPDAIAGEMEATAIHEAASHGLKPDWIMVKGISDWGAGKTKNDQQTAAGSAADFVTHVLAGGSLRRRRFSAQQGR
jgi:5'-methylthioadenosine/S-adenosylhomocysteine nucleosidase